MLKKLCKLCLRKGQAYDYIVCTFLNAHGKNRDIKEILRNLIGFSEDWEVEKTKKSLQNQNIAVYIIT